MLGFAGLLELGVHGALNEPQAEQVRRILSSGRHLQALVNDVLDLARIEAGATRVARQAIDVGSLCMRVVEMAEPLAAERQLTLTANASLADGLEVWGDEDRVRQILVNLVTNACKFTPPRGTVALRCSVSSRAPEGVASPWTGAWVGIEIADTGVGIGAAMQERVFAPFVQAMGNGREAGGAGLGLAISRTLARLMQGEVTLRSTPGEGSVFALWLQAGAPLREAG